MQSETPYIEDPGNETPANPKTGGLPRPGAPGRGGEGGGNETPANPKTGGLPRPGAPAAVTRGEE